MPIPTSPLVRFPRAARLAPLLLLLAALPSAGPAAAQTPAQDAKRPDFSGDWVLDEKRSDDPAAKLRELRSGGEGMGGRPGGGRGGGGMGGRPGLGGPGGGGGGPRGGGPGGGGPPSGAARPGGPDGAPRMMMLPAKLAVDHQNGVITYRGPEFPSQVLYTDGRVATRDTPRGQFELEAAWGRGDRLEVTYRPVEPPVEPAEPAAGISTGGPLEDRPAKDPGRSGRRALPPPREVWELVAERQRLLITTEIGPENRRVTIVRVYDRAP